MSVVNNTIQNVVVSSWVWLRQPHVPNYLELQGFRCRQPKPFTPFAPLRQWLNALNPKTPEFARFVCQVVPAQCPFEREIKCFGRTIVRIPPLCELNPFYNEVVGLRFRALCYLADECGEDISSYC
ncbi:MAG: Mo-dependent nitrogenase C-terminal domain-containing protein [Cyanobacteriota bacterium]|nr:Mo-dependent nitrogenase C-terminal domain-containing protein [Cyanobacteriota bacterium]